MKNIILISVLFLCMSGANAFAVLPPKYYSEAAEKSKIKATAIIKSVKVTGHHEAIDEKVVTFDLIKSFGPIDAPKEFTGRCKSVNRRWFERGPGAGGDIYYYPERGEKVYVTISEDGAYITSYTRLTPAIEKALDEDFKSVKTKMGTAYVAE